MIILNNMNIIIIQINLLKKLIFNHLNSNILIMNNIFLLLFFTKK